MSEAEFEQPQTNPPENASQLDHLRLLEALLFAASAPLSIADLHERMPPGADVGGALMDLKSHYEGRGVNLVETDGRWAMRTAADLGEYLQLERDVQKKLSRAALETLAVIAYHQPVTRAEVENIRGVATHKGTLDVLMEAGWIRPGKRRQTPGRPLTWVTTPVFLDQFSLESIMDLPGMDELKASGLLDRRPAIEAIPSSDDLFSSMPQGSAEEDDGGGDGDMLEEDELGETELGEIEEEEIEDVARTV